MPWALLVAVTLSQTQAAYIKAARDAMSDLRYPEARTLLQKARQQQGLTRDELVEVLWLQGLVAASLAQPDAARSAFRALFAIDPEHSPERDYPPKIMSPYYEARGWVATNKPLGFSKLPAETAGGRVRRIGVKLLGDPLGLAAGVRIHLVGGETTEHALTGLEATREVDAPRVAWWAELVGERDAQLAVLGSAQAPLVDAVAEPEPQAAPPEAVAVEEERPMSPLRAGGIVAGAASVASLGIGLVFGIRSNTMASALRSRTYEPDGSVAGWTQREAIGLELQQRREAGVANALFAAAGVLLVAAVVLLILGREP